MLSWPVPAASEGAAMTHQRTTSTLPLISRIVCAMAAVRLGIGAIGVLAQVGSHGGCSCLVGKPMRPPRWRCALRPPATSRLALARRWRPGADRGHCALAARHRTRRLLRRAHHRQEQVSKRHRTHCDRAGLRPVRRRADSPRPAAHPLTVVAIRHAKSSDINSGPCWTSGRTDRLSRAGCPCR